MGRTNLALMAALLSAFAAFAESPAVDVQAFHSATAMSGAFRLDLRGEGETGRALVSGTEMFGAPDGSGAVMRDTTELAEGWHRLSQDGASADILVRNDGTVAVEGGRLAANTTWGADKVHLVRHWVVVPNGVTLTIAAGTIVKFCEGTGILVQGGGKLSSNGTAAAEVVLAAAANDAEGGDTDLRQAVIVAGTYDMVVQTGGALADTGYTANVDANFACLPWVTVHDVVVSEDAGKAYIPVTLEGTRNIPFSLDWATADGTAMSGTDYAASSGTLKWNGTSDGTKWIEVPLAADASAEGWENFAVRITRLRGVNARTGEATVSVYDAQLGDGGAVFVAGCESESARLDTQTPIVAVCGQNLELRASPTGWTSGATPEKNAVIECDGAAIGAYGEECAAEWIPSAPGLRELRHIAEYTFQTNGETVAMCDEAAAFVSVLGDGTLLHDGGMIQDATLWSSGVVHVVRGSVGVAAPARLTIAEGAVVKFMPGASLDVAAGASCSARGAVFTHVNDDTAGGDTLGDGDASQPAMGDYKLTGVIEDDDSTEYRYMPPQTLQSNITSDTRLRGYRTYIVSNSVTVASGATLVLQPGTILKFNTDCQMTVNGTLDAQGTRAAPIVFTSLKDDGHGGDTNGDGGKTKPGGGDWNGVWVYGKADILYGELMYSGNGNERGIVQTSGSGALTMADCTVAHALNDGIWNWGGTIAVTNTVFIDTGWATAPYRGARNEYVNCVFYGNDVGICYWSGWSGNPVYKNCVFANCGHGWCELASGSYGNPPSGVSVANCLFWNPAGYGAQSCDLAGVSGNIWGDPQFVDAEGGDFRVAATSPCVDAGDGSVAPEFDWWGRPRMDVKAVEDAGTPDASGACPDIGIYEVEGAAAVPLPDLAVAGVTLGEAGALGAGDALVVTYVVTNRAPVAAAGIVRDVVRMKGADAATGGISVECAIVTQGYSLAPFGAAEFTAEIAVPALKAGKWKAGVEVNAHRDIFEHNLANNCAWTQAEAEIALEALANGASEIALAKGATAGRMLAELPPQGGMVRISGARDGAVSAYGGNGVVPTAGECAGGCASVALADGSLLVVYPARREGEKAYLVLENAGNSQAALSVEVAEARLELCEAAPSRIANAGEAAITLTGCGLGADSEVRLGGRVAKTVEVLNAAQIVATFDVEGLSEGMRDVGASAPGGASATLPGAVEVYAAKTGPKLRAWLEMPSSVRDGRVFTGYVCYANEGDSPMPMPVFKVVRNDSATRMGLAPGESLSETRLFVGGISPSHPAGVLKAGDEAKIPFYFQPFGAYDIALSHVKDIEDAAVTDFGGTKEYLAAMAQAATRLNLRGRAVYDVREFADLAIAELNGIPCAAACGRLVDAKTGEALAGAAVSLIAADPEAQLSPATATTDANGCFQLPGLADGEYRWLVADGNVLDDASTNTVQIAAQKDLNGISIAAVKGGAISGFVATADGAAVEGGVVALLDGRGGVVATTATDASGAFVFSGLADGAYGVRAMPVRGFACATQTGLAIDAASRNVETMLVLAKGAVLGGTVTFGGAVATNGTVQAIMDDGTSLQTLCATNGVYRFEGIAPGEYVVRYYSNTLESDDARVALASGDDARLDLAAKVRAIFEPTQTTGFDTCTTRFILNDPERAQGVKAWKWDFDSDGTIDSTAAEPEWTYSSLGAYTVTLTIEEESGETTSVYPDCVRVERKLATILAEGAIVFGENSGTLETLEIGENTLVLSGEPAAGTIAPGCVILGNLGAEGYCRRVVGAVKNGDVWELTTEEATWDEAYEQCTIATSGEGYLGDVAPPGQKRLLGASPARGLYGAGTQVSLYAQGGLDVSESIRPSIRFDYMRQKTAGGVVKERYALIGNLSVGAEVHMEGTVGVAVRKTFKIPFSIVIPTPVPGVTLGNNWEAYVEGDAHITGSATFGGTINTQLRLGAEWEKGGNVKWLKPFDVASSGYANGDVEGSASIRLGINPEFESKVVGTASAVFAVDAYIKGEISASAKAPATAGISVGLDFTGELNLVDWDWKFLNVKVGISKTIEGPHLDIVRYTAPSPDFDYSPSNPQAPASVSFIDKTEPGYWEFFGMRGKSSAWPVAWEWDFGNGLCASWQNPSTTYSEKGNYTVSLKARGNGINGPYRKKKTVRVGKPGDPPPPDEPDDRKRDTPKQSCDPNEMNGPMGVGEEKFVKPGEWLDYTIYFENKAGSEIADAQEVRVTNPLSAWLDWSTFEMREAAFNNINDAGLAGRSAGTSEIPLPGAAKSVRTSVSCDPETGVASWYIRVWDPAGAFGWPADGGGFLPANDATHRGEGHLSYRIKLRDDAPPGVKIVNSASIVFDYNPAIETDPSWTNTVAEVAKIALEIDGAATNLELIAGRESGELPEPAAKEGYVFGGWFTAPGGAGERVTAQSIVSSAVARLYGFWEEDAYLVRFESEGGTGAMSPQAIRLGKAIALDPNTFKRAGYSFAGWARVRGGAVAFADRAIVENLASGRGATVVLYAVWTKDEEPPSSAPPEDAPRMCRVVFDAAGGEGGWERELAEGAQYAVPGAVREGYVFAGWEPEGPAALSTAVVPPGGAAYTARWEREWIAPAGMDGEGAADYGEPSLATAQVWDGWITAADGTLVGVLQVKTGKAAKKTGLSKVVASIALAGAKKQTIAMSAISPQTRVSAGVSASGEELRVEFGQSRLVGTCGAFNVTGSLNRFAVKDSGAKATAGDALEKWIGPVNIAWPGADGWDVLTVSIAKKGKVKVAGTVAGDVKLAGTAQVVQGDTWSAVPVVIAKKQPMAFTLWLGGDGATVELDDEMARRGAIAGKCGVLENGAAFSLDADALAAKLGDATYSKYLPVGTSVVQSGSKWIVPKAGKLVVSKKSGEIDDAKAGDNPAALKLTYAAKTGAFKGSFKAYVEANGKPKALAAKIAGVMIDGMAYGTAVIKKIAAIAVQIK